MPRDCFLHNHDNNVRLVFSSTGDYLRRGERTSIIKIGEVKRLQNSTIRRTFVRWKRTLEIWQRDHRRMIISDSWTTGDRTSFDNSKIVPSIRLFQRFELDGTHDPARCHRLKHFELRYLKNKYIIIKNIQTSESNSPVRQRTIYKVKVL